MKKIKKSQMETVKGGSARDCWTAVAVTVGCLPVSMILAQSCTIAGLSWF